MQLVQNLEALKKKIRYRATHLGLKELDIALALFLNEHLDHFDLQKSILFISFLDEPNLHHWILYPNLPVPIEYCDFLDQITQIFLNRSLQDEELMIQSRIKTRNQGTQ
jgi:succinate dehydrogenase flavin-adding protein (antitoxin of CptAB toxin-antitoxin module)